MIRCQPAWFVAALVIGVYADAAAGSTVKPVYPGKTWATKRPADVGMAAAKLA